MRPSGLLLLVAVSLSLAIAAPARTRPHYGGTLRVAIGEAPASLDPAESNRLGNSMLPSLSRLIFDTLVTLDARGQASTRALTFMASRSRQSALAVQHPPRSCIS